MDKSSKYYNEFKFLATAAATQTAALTMISTLILTSATNYCPGRIQSWLKYSPTSTTSPSTSSTLKTAVSYVIVLASVFVQTLVLATNFIQRTKTTNTSKIGLVEKINRVVITYGLVSYLFFYFFTVPDLAWGLVNPNTGKRSINEVNIIIFAYAMTFTHEILKLNNLDRQSILESSVGLSSNGVSVTARLVVEPVKKAFKCGVKSLFIVYVMYGISPIGSWIRMAVNSVMLKQDEQHLEFTFFQGIFGFYPILIVLGSRLLLVSTFILFTLENSINFIRTSNLSIRKTGVNLSNKSIGSTDEFEAQITKSELLHLLDHQKDQKSHLFSLSGTPKQPKMWNEIVGSTISNIDGFIDSNLTNSKTNNPGKLDKSKNSSKIINPTAAAEESVDVKIWSDQRRRILGSSLLSPTSRKVVEENNADKIGKVAADKAKKEASEVGKSTSVILRERADKLTNGVIEHVQKSVMRVHREFDSMLGIDVYDRVKQDKVSAGKQSLYNICQNVGILGEMAVAMSMYDTKVHVSFQSQYPIYKILETLLRLLKSIENYEADSQKNNGKSGNISESAGENQFLPLHGLDTLKDDVTGAVVKILHAFGRHTIESDFKRIELRPYYENYRDIISN